MTYEQVIAEAQRLAIGDQLRLLEDLSRTVRERISLPEEPARDDEAIWREELEEERAAILHDVPADSSLHALLGVGRTRRDVLMSREEAREIVTDSLMEKYGIERSA